LPEIQNPNLQSQGPGGGGGNDFRSLLIMSFLAVAVFLGFQYFQKPKPNAPEAPVQQQSAQTPAPAGTAPTQASPAPASGSAKAPAQQPTVAAASETETVVDNPNYRIVFTNRGGLVKHWILKHYFDSTGKPMDMVQQQASQQFGFPLSVFTYDAGLTKQLNSALYRASATGTLEAPAVLTFQYQQNGLDVTKTFRFNSTFVVNAELEVHRDGQPVRALLAWPAGLGDMEEFQGRSSIPGLSRTPSSLDWSINGSHDSEAPKKISNNATLDGNYQYAAATDLYFAAVFLPDVPERTTLVTFHNAIDLPTDLTNPASEKKPADLIGLAVGDTSGDTKVRLYVGPKQMSIVSSIHAMGPDGKPDGPTLHALIHFGWFAFLAEPLFYVLRFMVEHGIPNWGWDIILLTAIFNALMLPTRVMMMKSSLKMARIQPKVEALKRKYAHLKATDPKRAEMNTEMMALYKTEGVNMYGSCLPMLIQMPLFFAYFEMLQNTVELRQAHWLWLPDLSRPDPLHILPIGILISMFLAQYITPSPGMDQSQRRMMAIVMPVMFGFMLWHYASGLALYWITGNLISLFIQLAINQSHLGKEMQALAARRAAKKLGKRPPTIQARR